MASRGVPLSSGERITLACCALGVVLALVVVNVHSSSATLVIALVLAAASGLGVVMLLFHHARWARRQ